MSSRLSLSVPNIARETKHDAHPTPGKPGQPGAPWPNPATLDALPSDAARRLLVELAHRAGPDGTCIVGTRSLAKDLGTHRRGTQRRLDRLEQNGLIRREPIRHTGFHEPLGMRVHLCLNRNTAGEDQ